MDPHYITIRPMVYDNPWLHKIAAKASNYDVDRMKSIDDTIDADDTKRVQAVHDIPMMESSRDCTSRQRYDFRGRYVPSVPDAESRYIDEEA